MTKKNMLIIKFLMNYVWGKEDKTREDKRMVKLNFKLNFFKPALSGLC